MTSQDESKSIVKRYLTAFNDRDWDRLEDLLAADAVEHGIHDELHGFDEIVDFLDSHFEAFPDYSGTTEAITAEDELVTVRYRATGTHTGEYKDLEPTGLTAEWTGLAMYRVENGKVAEIWVEEDRLGLLEQLDLVSAAERPHLRL